MWGNLGERGMLAKKWTVHRHEFLLRMSNRARESKFLQRNFLVMAPLLLRHYSRRVLPRDASRGMARTSQASWRLVTRLADLSSFEVFMTFIVKDQLDLCSPTEPGFSLSRPCTLSRHIKWCQPCIRAGDLSNTEWWPRVTGWVSYDPSCHVHIYIEPSCWRDQWYEMVGSARWTLMVVVGCLTVQGAAWYAYQW